MTDEDLELDTRISGNLQHKLDLQMDVVRRKKEFDYERVKLAGRKLMEYFIDPVHFPVQVIGVTNGKTIYSFRIKKLGDDFKYLKKELEQKLRQAAKNKR